MNIMYFTSFGLLYQLVEREERVSTGRVIHEIRSGLKAEGLGLRRGLRD
jgi:hypothetical protein